MSARRTYGWKPDLPDQRDRVFAARFALTDLPPRVDLRAGCSPIENQGPLGSCTGHGIVALLEYNAIRDKHPCDLSRLFVYYQERVIEGTVRQDAGAMIRTGIKTCVDIGVPLERYWPYNIDAFRRRPGKRAYNDAAKNRVTSYERVLGLNSLKNALAGNQPVVFGFSVYESFETPAVDETGKVPMPQAHERLLGGHCVAAVGYDDVTECITFRNSYGSAWGAKGYGTMPYAYVQNASLSDDFWLIRH